MSATRQLLRIIDAQAAWSALLQPRGQVRHFILGLHSKCYRVLWVPES